MSELLYSTPDCLSEDKNKIDLLVQTLFYEGYNTEKDYQEFKIEPVKGDKSDLNVDYRNDIRWKQTETHAKIASKASGDFVSEKLQVSLQPCEPLLGVTKTVKQIDGSEIASELTEVKMPNKFSIFSETSSPSQIKNELNLSKFVKIKNSSYILDIDLDFYSTQNPFLILLGKNCFEKLQRLYYFRIAADITSEELEKTMLERKKQLDELENMLTHLSKGGSINELPKNSRTEDLKDLVENLTKERIDIDYTLLHDAGCSCDVSPLPHYVTDLDEIRHLVQETGNFLYQLPRPAIITISRSSEDDYCPNHQVETIQGLVLDMLKDLYGELDVRYDYKLGDKSADGQVSQEVQH